MKTRIPAVFAVVLAVVLAVSFVAGATTASAQYRKPAPGTEVVSPGAPKLPSPDLVVVTGETGHMLYPCVVEGKYSRIDVFAVFKNAGPGPAYAPHGIEVRAYPSRTLLVPPTYVTTAKPVGHGPKQLNPGESTTVKLLMTIGPAADNKPYDIMVQLDPGNVVAETNESNNIAAGFKIPALVDSCTAVK